MPTSFDGVIVQQSTASLEFLRVMTSLGRLKQGAFQILDTYLDMEGGGGGGEVCAMIDVL